MDLDDVVNGYIDAMLWAEPARDFNADPDDDTAFDSAGFDRESLTDGARQSIETDCRKFIDTNADDLAEYAERRAFSRHDGTVAEHAGHDFYLTRQGHGVGFWDRDLDALGDRLTIACDSFGETYAFATTNDLETARVEVEGG